MAGLIPQKLSATRRDRAPDPVTRNHPEEKVD
jgi:hypothetical protein